VDFLTGKSLFATLFRVSLKNVKIFFSVALGLITLRCINFASWYFKGSEAQTSSQLITPKYMTFLIVMNLSNPRIKGIVQLFRGRFETRIFQTVLLNHWLLALF
jgi:hypothetical protein